MSLIHFVTVIFKEIVYADKAECDTDPQKKLFNCYQRAHQNTLENYPHFIILLGISAINYPNHSAIGGLVWLVGKYFYATGYFTGTPANRNRGAFSYLGLFLMLGCSIMTCYEIIIKQ